MAPTQEQKVSYDSEADSTTHTLTITEPVENRLMVLVAAASAVLNTPSGWSLAISATNDPDVRIFYRIAPASFGTSVQFASDFSCSASAVYLEYSGIVDTSPLDRTASQTSVDQTGTTATTTQASELLIGAIGRGGTNADNNWSAWSDSFVEEHDLASSGGSFNVSLGVASRVVSSTGTYGTSATSGAGSGPAGCIATFKAAPDAINKVADRGTAQNLTAESSTAVDMAAAGSITVGNYLIARLALDNAGGGGAAVTLGVTDPRSNTWTIKGPANQDPGAASAGTTCYIAYAKVANAYTNGDDITFTYNGTNVTAKAIVVEEWTGIHATTPEAVAETTATGASTTPSISRTPAAAGQLFYGALSIEGPSGDTYTQDADTTDGSWQTLTNLSTTSGTATNNQTVRGAAKFVTGTTAQTWNPTITSRDWAMVALVFAPAGANTVNGVGAGTFTFTGAASGAPRTPGTAAGSFTFTGAASGVPDVQGQAAASLTFTGSASGATQGTVTGTGAGPYTFTGVASGAPNKLGQASGTYTFTGIAAGVPDVQGASTAALDFSGTASGTVEVFGQAAAAITFTGAAAGFAGAPPVQGQGAGTYTFTGTGAGVDRAVGQAAGSVTFTGTAAGVPDVHGTAAAALTFGGAATGVRVRLGQAVTTLTFTGSALGAPVLFGQCAAALTFTGTAAGIIPGQFPDPNPFRLTFRQTSTLTFDERSTLTYREAQ